MKTAGAHNWSSAATGVALIGAIYVYFLIFAQFAFLHVVETHVATAAAVRSIMGEMALAGLLFSLGTARWFRVDQLKRLLSGGFAGCAVGALLATRVAAPLTLGIVSAFIGIGLSVLTVSLSAGLCLALPRAHRGICIGLGTGLAYALCNTPAVFGGSPIRQSWLAALVCVCGLVLALTWRWSPEPCQIDEVKPEPANPFVPLVVIFATLVWLDSAAFLIIQTTPALNQFGWGSATLQWSNAAMHFALALLAGRWLDRGALLPVLVCAFMSLATAALVSTNSVAAQWMHWLYAGGVSLYSTALVFTPIRNGASDGCTDVARRAGILYGIAGWGGSAFGIGMAQDLHTIPTWFVCLAGIVIVTQVIFYRRFQLRHIISSCTAATTLGLMIALTSDRPAEARVNDVPKITARTSAAMGREIYMSEGCIHCHSQFIRPGTSEEEWWGPAAESVKVLRDQPPLIGNRRQGPDLLNVGNRRSAVWNTIHLINPRAFSRNSCMPSYAYLFHPGDPRGDELVAYLSTLRSETITWRYAIRERWAPGEACEPASADRAQQLFQSNCVACHGRTGHGNGEFAKRLGPRDPRDLTKGQWQFIPKRATEARRVVEIARVIKFGIPATSMPGHETLSDGDLLALARYVESLQNSPLPL